MERAWDGDAEAKLLLAFLFVSFCTTLCQFHSHYPHGFSVFYWSPITMHVQASLTCAHFADPCITVLLINEILGMMCSALNAAQITLNVI